MDRGRFDEIRDNQMIPENLKKYDYRKNIIVDENNPILIWKSWRDHSTDGQAYLSRPYSKDALTWNVFRSLQKLVTWQLIGKTIEESNIIDKAKILSKIDEALSNT